MPTRTSTRPSAKSFVNSKLNNSYKHHRQNFFSGKPKELTITQLRKANSNDWYDFRGALVTNRRGRLELYVTDIDVDMRGAKDQIAAEELGYA